MLVFPRLFAFVPRVLLAIALVSATALAQDVSSTDAPAGDPASPLVLMLHSYDLSSEWTLNMGRGLRESLASRGHRVDVRSEFLDFRRDSRREYKAALYSLLRTKYATVPIALIVTTDDAALEFLLDHPVLMGSSPVVFGGVNNDALAARVPRIQVTGVREQFRLDAIVDAALRVRPGTRRLLIVTDDTLLGQSVRQGFREAMSGRPPLDLVELSTADLGLDELLDRLTADTTPRDLVIATALVRDRTGRHFLGTFPLTRIGAASRAPVVAIGMRYDTGNVLAGTVDNGVEHGARMGHVAARLLAGTPPADIPIEADDTTLLAFDAAQLARWDIPERMLPAGTVVFNRPASIYRANKTAIWTGVAVLVGQSLIIGGLVVNVRRRRRADRRLAEHAHVLSAQAAELASANAQLESANRSLREEQETRQQAEAHLRQAQKMEAVGRLAGGVAHDFNNLLTIIIGYCILLMEERPANALHAEALAQIRRASEQAAALTQNLLAFSRRQLTSPAVVDVVATVAGLEPMLRRFCGGQVGLVLDLDDATGHVELGKGQFEQIVINLVINARDAMPRGGQVRVTTRREALASPPAVAPDLEPGDYVVLTVRDTGIGMDAETRARVFEPFFTTKTLGRGTGLGLATVYGIVTQHRGRIAVSSEPGEGSTFTLWLPLTRRPSPAACAGHDHAGAGSPCRVLLAEDEAELRSLVARVLRDAGYDVIEAGDGAQALGAAQAQSGTIDVLLTDVVMPGMDGFTLARQLRALLPGLAVAYVSGYTDMGAQADAPSEEAAPVLRKPFLPADLLAHLSRALEASRTRDAATSG